MNCEFAKFAAIAATLTVLSGAVGSAARAANIIDEWASVKMPPAPELKAVTVDPKTTALLMLDFVPHDPYCGPGKPRCPATVPAVKRLLDQARSKGAIVVYSVAGKYEASDIIKDLAPAAGDPWVKSKADKFVNTDLEKILKNKGIQTVIVTGNSANAGVLYTGTEAALRGLKVVVPVDVISAGSLFEELLAVWELAHGPGFGQLVTITKSDVIKF